MPQKPDKFLPALYGGIIMGVISGVPLLGIVNCLCCAGIMFGGFMSVYFYKKQLTAEMDPMTSSDAMGLGAFSGIFGAIVAIILSGLFILLMGNVTGEIVKKILESTNALNNMPPEARDQMEQSLEQTGLSIISVVANFIMHILFGFLGGLIGYAVFKKKGAANPAQ